jgi:divalent metal cation (Fe/Co/Zn/Cd) transporter
MIGGVKSFVGEIPVGNTGGANVPPLKQMEIPAELKSIMSSFVESAETIRVSRLYRAASGLILFTILYNLVEGVVSVYFGLENESLTLFGFGIDSFIEVLSGLGVAHMIFRIQSNPGSNRDNFERNALKITGIAFYILVVGLTITSLYNAWTDHKPETTFWGIVIAVISILIMWVLILGKLKVGRELNSPAIIADAQCTKVCIYMSVILLGSSLIYEYFRVSYVDSVATLGLAYYSFKEGKECFEKSRNSRDCCENC